MDKEFRQSLTVTGDNSVLHVKLGVLSTYTDESCRFQEHSLDYRLWTPIKWQEKLDAWDWIKVGEMTDIHCIHGPQVEFTFMNCCGREQREIVGDRLDAMIERMSWMEREREAITKMLKYCDDYDQDQWINGEVFVEWEENDELIGMLVDRLVRAGKTTPKELVQLGLFDVVHWGSTRWEERRKWCHREQIFAETWNEYASKDNILGLMVGKGDHIDQNDACFAADLMQWLGTNCGQEFLSRCLKKIKKLDATYEFIRRAKMEENKIAKRTLEDIASALINRLAAKKMYDGKSAATCESHDDAVTEVKRELLKMCSDREITLTDDE